MAKLASDYFFAFDSAELRDTRLLKQLLALVSARPEGLSIVGRTDGLGPAERNLDLSRERAEAVRRWLVDHGVTPARILSVMGVGEKGAPDGVATPRLRRVDVRFGS